MALVNFSFLPMKDHSTEKCQTILKIRTIKKNKTKKILKERGRDNAKI